LGDRQVDPITEQGDRLEDRTENVRVVTPEQAARAADLPEEVGLALTDIVAVAREGLLAMSVAAGMAVMQTMFEAEVTAVAGAKDKHNPDRGAVRHGSGKAQQSRA
jgi:putative transposase